MNESEEDKLARHLKRSDPQTVFDAVDGCLATKVDLYHILTSLLYGGANAYGNGYTTINLTDTQTAIRKYCEQIIESHHWTVEEYVKARYREE